MSICAEHASKTSSLFSVLGRQAKTAAITLAFIGLASACSTTSESSGASVSIAPKVTLRLPRQEPFGGGANAIQLVQAVYKDRTETFQAIITSKDGSMSLVMTVPNGPRIMSFEWNGEKLTSNYESIAPKGLSAEHMLADIITIYAPAALVGTSLKGGKLEVSANGTREIDNSTGPVIRVTFPGSSGGNPWAGRAILENLAFEYRLDISSQPIAN